MKNNKKLNVKKRKFKSEISKETFLTKGDNIEKNVINLLKNNDNYRNYTTL